MPESITVVYNEIQPSFNDKNQEAKAVSEVLASVEAVRRALLNLGYSVKVIPLLPPAEQIEEVLGSLDASIVFNLFEGFPGEPETEPLVPEILSKMGIPYTGCPAAVLKKGLDKYNFKKKLKAAGIPTPDFQLLSMKSINRFKLKFPCIVKPCHEDASNGITSKSVVNDIASLKQRIKKIHDGYGNKALVEEFINGGEFNITVMGNAKLEVLPVSEIVYTLPPDMPRILTYEAKWEPDSLYYKNSKAVCPAKISDEERTIIQKTALEVYCLLGCSGYARADMRMDKKGIINVIEMNPNPDISPDAGVALQAAAAGLSYEQLVEKIIKLALDKEKHESKNTSSIKFRPNCLNTDIRKYAGI